jgi:lipoic acid synthetase
MLEQIKRKPDWLRKKITPSLNQELEQMFSKSNLNTVCQEAMCPNISECFSKKQATFMILGNICTRACTFCAVSKGLPVLIDRKEPENVAKAVESLGLKHVVITSPTRDDLKDGGAKQFCETVEAIKNIDNSIVVELLISDMKENEDSLRLIANSGAEIIGHNLESIEPLYHIRKGADYKRSLRVLKFLGKNPNIATKSAIMLGFGEKRNEVVKLMQDLLDVGCRYLSIGQYLQPSKNHESVVEYVDPNEFELLRKIALEMGFKYVKSSPYTRSSYMAHEYLE